MVSFVGFFPLPETNRNFAFENGWQRNTFIVSFWGASKGPFSGAMSVRFQGGFRILPSYIGISISDYMGVSKNSGTPKSSILIGFSIINHPFWGAPIFGNTHI